MDNSQILIGGGTKQVFLQCRFANRHGLIAGATGTGKTVTLQVLAEGFSRIGVPVFLADVKGDISGISQPGKPHPKVDERVEKIGLENYSQRGFPVAFWDLFGKKGTPVRSTISEICCRLWWPSINSTTRPTSCWSTSSSERSAPMPVPSKTSCMTRPPICNVRTAVAFDSIGGAFGSIQLLITTS